MHPLVLTGVWITWLTLTFLGVLFRHSAQTPREMHRGADFAAMAAGLALVVTIASVAMGDWLPGLACAFAFAVAGRIAQTTTIRAIRWGQVLAAMDEIREGRRAGE